LLRPGDQERTPVKDFLADVEQCLTQWHRIASGS
jgi:hypothetical protein